MPDEFIKEEEFERDKDLYYELIPRKYTVGLQLNRSHTPELVFRHNHIAITDYHMGDNREFEKSLSIFDEINWKYRLIGGYYVKALHEFRINRAYDLYKLAKFFPGYRARVDNNAYPADKIDIQLLTPPRNDIQLVTLTFMCAQGEFQRNAKYTNMMIDLPTGEGKSYSGVAATAFLRGRAVVIVPFSKLLKQWEKSFVDFTSLTADEVMIVKGSEGCLKILNGKCRDVKVFIFMVDTLVSFHDRYGDMETIEMLRMTNAYVKIVDEVHRDMKAITMIEALSNFRMNYYMSASPGRADDKENWIFRTCFKNMPRFGAGIKTQEEKHINIIIRGYRFTPTPEQQQRMVQPRKKWLNSKSYEKELFNAPDYQIANFKEAVSSMMKWSKGILKPDNKVLILCETVDGTGSIKEVVEEFFPGKVSRYYGSMKPAEKEEALKATVICATISSLGTGADIKGIQHVYNLTTYSNWITAVQTAGRARKLPDGTQTFYIELVNFSYRKTAAQFEKRKPQLLKISRTGKLMMVE